MKRNCKEKEKREVWVKPLRRAILREGTDRMYFMRGKERDHKWGEGEESERECNENSFAR